MHKRTVDIRNYILNNVGEHATDLVNLTASEFHISRQSASGHVGDLVKQNLLVASGKTKARKYELKNFIDELFTLDVTAGFEEDIIWREKILPLISDLTTNVINICQYGVTEILNNVMAHSEASQGYISIERNAIRITIFIRDYGIGIFNKIQRDFNLHDPRHALLELSKGKLTSDNKHHSGNGIFFTSRMFDEFSISSGTLFYHRLNKGDDWLIETKENAQSDGTFIAMKINVNSSRTTAEIFKQVEIGEIELDFSRTHVPLKLARYGTEQLVSRSQAKRVLARFEEFKEVLLDFQGIDEVGPAFIDEIFRVYQSEHPKTDIIGVYASPQIQQLINNARQARWLTPEQP
jgi:anti-sigma regulatory factor (Ser/Thr protein kinase)